MKNARSLYLQVLDLLRRNLRHAKVSDSAYGTELSNTQARVLDEWDRAPESTNAIIGKQLGLDASSVSRIFKRLVKLNYLSYEKSKIDGRRKSLSVTKKGEKFLELLRNHTNLQVELQSKRLSTVELLSFIRFMKSFADGGLAPKLTVVSYDNELTTLLRRLAYAHGVFTGNYAGSGYSASTLMILSEIKYSAANANELKQILTISQSTLSVRLKSLSSQGLINSKVHPEDKRLRQLALTSKGEVALEHIEKCSEELFSSSLSEYSETEIDNFVKILRKYVGPCFAANERPLGAHLSIMPVDSESDCKTLRWLLVDILKNSDKNYPLNSTLFSLNNIKLAIKKDGEIVGGLEFSSELELINYILLDEIKTYFTFDDLKEAVNSIFPSKEFYFYFSKFSL